VRRPLANFATAGFLGLLCAYAACQPLPEWPAFELGGAGGTPVVTPAGAAGTDGAAGTTGAAGTGVAGTTGAAGTSSQPMTGQAGQAGTTGAAGTTGVAGTTGAAGTTGVAGTTGAAGTMAAPDPIAEARLALANLDNFSWTKSCKFSDNGKDVTVLSGCQAADICWETADLGRTYETRNIQINGVAGHRYQFDLRLRGVIEPRDYPVAPNCTRLPNMPADTVGVSECADGFANKAQVTFNVMELSIPNPAKKYYFNTVRVHPPHRVDLADWKWNVTVAANQSLKFTYDDLNGGMIRNCNKSINGADVVVKQQPFNGQWLQLNVDYASVKVLE
jgi:hypothetical protein